MDAPETAGRLRAPTSGGDDELLADPPAGPPPGGIDAYRAGFPLRIVLVALIGLALVGTVWLVKRSIEVEDAEREAPMMPSYSVSADVDDVERPQQLVWTDGIARLGLSRTKPGVQEIVLPDRRIRLARGHDVAQIKVEVRDGVTVGVAVLVGEVVQLPSASPRSPPDPPATAP